MYACMFVGVCIYIYIHICQFNNPLDFNTSALNLRRWSMRAHETAESSFFVAAMCISFLARESQIMSDLVEPRPWAQLRVAQDLRLVHL